MTFKAPCDCNAVAGLKAYFPNMSGVLTNQVFLFTDAHGNNLTGVGHLFATGALVKVILNVDEGKAYIQNADTNAYLEGRFENIDASGPINEHNSSETAHGDIRALVSAAQATADSKAPMYTYGTEDLEAGVSELASGTLYLVHE